MNEVVEQLLKTDGSLVGMVTFPFGRFDNLGISLLIDDMTGQSLAQVVRDLFLPYGKVDIEKESEVLLQDLLAHYQQSYASIPALEVLCEGGEEQIIEEFSSLVFGITHLIVQYAEKLTMEYNLVYIDLDGADTVILGFKMKPEFLAINAAVSSATKSLIQDFIIKRISARKALK